jgi:hypothetical protein
MSIDMALQSRVVHCASGTCLLVPYIVTTAEHENSKQQAMQHDHAAEERFLYL